MVIDIPLTSWTPDRADLENPGLTALKNVVPGIGNGQGQVTYTPVRSAVLWADTSLTSLPRGATTGLDSIGNSHTFVGTANKLHKFGGLNRDWFDVSRTSAPYSTASGENWRYVEYGQSIIATNFSDHPQIFNMDGGTKFEDLTTLVNGKHIAEHRGFVLLANTFDNFDGGVPNRIRWSALENPYDWAFSQAGQADFQDLQDVGAINGIISDEDVWLLCKDAIVRMTYVNAPLIFEFRTAVDGKGCAYPQSVITVEGVTYYLDDDGFYSFQKGQLTPIGLGKVDNFFYSIFDSAQARTMTAVADPRQSLIYWTFASKSTLGVPDTTLIYNYRTGDWSLADASAPYLFSTLSLATTIEELSVYGDIANIPEPFDSPVWAGGNAILWALDTEGRIYTMTGPPKQGYIDTAEYQLGKSENNRSDRATISGVRPVFENGGTALVTIATRELNNRPYNWSDPYSINEVDGYAKTRIQSRYQRIRVTLAGDWDKFSKIQVDFAPAGAR